MPHSIVELLSRGNFIFVRPDVGEIRSVFPEADGSLPSPQTVFLSDEEAAPLEGFPVLSSKAQSNLDSLLQEYLEAEEEAQVAAMARKAFDSKAYGSRRQAYFSQLFHVLESISVASLSYDYASIFWLLHSLPAARVLKETPRRVLRQDPTFGRDHGDAIRYRVLERWLDRVEKGMEEIGKKLAVEMSEAPESFVPPVLPLMRDNVLIFTEDYISPDFSELAGFFRGFLGEDFRDFRQRWSAMEEWHAGLISRDPTLRGLAIEILGLDPDAGDSRKILFRDRYVSFLARLPTYPDDLLLTRRQVDLWNRELLRLKRYELLHALRKLLIPLSIEDDKLICRDRSLNASWVLGPPVLELSKGTRPIDFSAPWVVDPVVHRFGLVYDITEFSATISMLGRVEKTAIENAFRMTVRFQRQIDRLAVEMGLRLEKYLGDGAFYSSRRSRAILAMAILMQRLYPDYVKRGFPFDKGMRLALNLGEYRLLPLASEDRTRLPAYEYFGHGLVELSRLSTGKKTQEIDTFKNFLMSQGYPQSAVNQFFAPMQRKNAELVSKLDEARPFYAYINQSDTLINEGIVATESFVQHLGSFDGLRYAREHGRGFIVVDVESPRGAFTVGLRKLGKARFKGLDSIAVYEVVDGRHWDAQRMKNVPAQPLTHALERLFTQTMAATSQAR